MTSQSSSLEAFRFESPQNLLIDLDDTICENNIYFERSIADFISYVNHEEFTTEQVREVINQAERDTIVQHGYGLHSFAHSLVAAFERLSKVPVTEDIHRTIHGFAHRIADHPLELIEGVPETLQYLSDRHHLILMTKGRLTEQMSKIERSGVHHLFNAVEVVAEKNEPTYREVMGKYALSPEMTWMIGNSPKSDINPALAAGLHAIFVPHCQTWVLEHEEIAEAKAEGQRLLHLERFTDLARIF